MFGRCQPRPIAAPDDPSRNRTRLSRRRRGAAAGAGSVIALGFPHCAGSPARCVLCARLGRVRIFIVCAAALYGGLNAVLQILVVGSDVGDVANTVNTGVLAGIVAAIAYAMMRVDGADLFPAAAEAAPAIAASQPVGEDAADQKLIDALMRLMAHERIYR